MAGRPSSGEGSIDDAGQVAVGKTRGKRRGRGRRGGASSQPGSLSRAAMAPMIARVWASIAPAKRRVSRASRTAFRTLPQVAAAPPDPGALVLAGAPRRLILARAVIREAPAGPCRRPISACTPPRQPIVGRSASPRVPLFQPPISAAGRPPGPPSSSPKGPASLPQAPQTVESRPRAPGRAGPGAGTSRRCRAGRTGCRTPAGRVRGSARPDP